MPPDAKTLTSVNVNAPFPGSFWFSLCCVVRPGNIYLKMASHHELCRRHIDQNSNIRGPKHDSIETTTSGQETRRTLKLKALYCIFQLGVEDISIIADPSTPFLEMVK